jgi:hypothetical protein
MKSDHHKINVPEFVNIMVFSTRAGLGIFVMKQPGRRVLYLGDFRLL